MARNYGNGTGPKGESAIVMERKGPLSYTVQLTSGQIWRRHIVNFEMECQTLHVLTRPLSSQESQGPEQELLDQSEAAETEPTDTHDPPENSGKSWN